MKDLLKFIVENLVSKPDAILIDEQSSNGEVNLMLTVDPTDMGLIIGKGGQTIRAIRKILTVRAIAENVRVNLQLAEPVGGRPEAEESEELEKLEEPEATEAEEEKQEDSEKSDESEETKPQEEEDNP